jgi:ankyrin repeat protein
MCCSERSTNRGKKKQVVRGRLRSTSCLAHLLDSIDYYTHKNQLILAKQHGKTAMHHACFAANVTNLDFIEYLLKDGADPNAQDHLEKTPLMLTPPHAPGAAKFLLNWPNTDVNMLSTCSGLSFLDGVRSTIPLIPTKVQP